VNWIELAQVGLKDGFYISNEYSSSIKANISLSAE
jgi:hypothetical protein